MPARITSCETAGAPSRSVPRVSAIELGAEFGPSSWIDVPQERIQAFADATGDYQFIHPVPSGSRVRGSFHVDTIEEHEWGRQVTMTATVEREDGEKPVCVAEVVFRYYRLPGA